MLLVIILLLGLLAFALTRGAVAARGHLEVRMQLLEMMGVAIRRGLPLPSLIRKAAAGSPKTESRSLMQLARDLEQGEDLTEALEWALPDSFPPEARSAIQAADGTEELPVVMRALSQQADDRIALQHRTTMAVLYPLGLLALTVLVAEAGRFLAVLPNWGPVQRYSLLSLNLSGGVALNEAGLILLTVIVALSVACFWRRSGMVRRLARDFLWRLPLRSRASSLLGSGQYLDTLACLVRAGVALPTAMIRAIGVATCPRLAGRIRTAAAGLEEGWKFEDGMHATGLPAYAIAGVCAAGRATPDHLADAMAGGAREVRERYLNARERWLGLVNPVLLLVAGFFVGSYMLHAVTASVRVIQVHIPW